MILSSADASRKRTRAASFTAEGWIPSCVIVLDMRELTNMGDPTLAALYASRGDQLPSSIRPDTVSANSQYVAADAQPAAPFRQVHLDSLMHSGTIVIMCSLSMAMLQNRCHLITHISFYDYDVTQAGTCKHWPKKEQNADVLQTWVFSVAGKCLYLK